MINLISILFVLGIQLIAGVILFVARSSRDAQGRDKKFPLRFVVSILGGALPLALLGANIIERDGLAVLLALVGFVYFILIKKA